MDFYRILTKEPAKGRAEIIPDFRVGVDSKDLMIRGGKFYAIWDQEKGVWSRDERDVQRLVDKDLEDFAKARQEADVHVRYMEWDDTRSWHRYKQYVKESPDNFVPLDTKVMFSNSTMRKEDYASFQLSYALDEGDISAWDKLTSTLYAPAEREKFEWAIGAIIAGDAKWIQKFLVFYGSHGTGKSTILKIVEKLFPGYCAAFDGKALGSSTQDFALEAFGNHPLVAIQHDSDLSKIEDNARLNSIISHEAMTINEKYKSIYEARIDAILLMASNQPVKISDAKSGIIRRLIDVHPTGITFAPGEYFALLSRVMFELGAIAWHCLQVHQALGPNYYNAYRPTEMMLQTDAIYNFIEDHFDVFKAQDHVTLHQAWEMYKKWCEESGIKYPLSRQKLREELRNYFLNFSPREYVDGQTARSVYQGFIGDRFKGPKAENGYSIVKLDETKSLLDEELSGQSAQYASTEDTPEKPWRNVTTRLEDIDSGMVHFLKVPPNHIVIDFDLKAVNGHTALERNLEAASHWPPTYAEISKSGDGIHLHYNYDGDVSKLATQYQEGIEVKVYSGNASLRRRLTWCNAIPIATISSGLPLKKQEKMLTPKTITSEKGLRELINRNLRKEIHPGTKPSVDFIKKILDDAYESGIKYDVSDLKTKIVAFANNSTNQAALSLKTVREMKWTSDDGELSSDSQVVVDDDRIAFFDVEVYKNLFVVCWKFLGSDTVIELVNPKPFEIEQLFRLKLVGFYNRRFDNHILYAASMGASNEDLYKLAIKLIEGNKGVAFGSAYNLSYADVWDFSSEKMSLKKFEIKLGILHMELDFPWDQPVNEKDWGRVVEYCSNDVRATEAVFEDRKGDFIARQILAELSGLTVNDTTQAHTAKIIFGNDKHPQKKFNYTDLSQEFPGYKFELGKSSYKGEDPGEGGYVYAEPGMYEKVAVLDVVSMHPTSIEILNLFGPYTKNFSDLKRARVLIKHGEFDQARKMLDGRLSPFLVPISDLGDVDNADALSYALKIVINTVYGLTSAKFDNPFRDVRNVDNIVAKRGALFMIDLKEQLQDAGHQVVHIKTDSVKIPNATPEAIAMVKTIGSLYRYEFDHEETYDKFCLVNDAVYVAGLQKVPWDGGFPGYDWKAVGAQFQHPYVFKTLFSGEDLEFRDYCEARSVIKGAMYLDLTGSDLDQPDHTKMRHVGRTGLFVPVLTGGGVLYRMHEDRYYAVSGTKNHLWMEAHAAEALGDQVKIDMSYFEKLKTDAIATIEKFGSFRDFVER
jgi:hypothetical protein